MRPRIPRRYWPVIHPEQVVLERMRVELGDDDPEVLELARIVEKRMDNRGTRLSRRAAKLVRAPPLQRENT